MIARRVAIVVGILALLNAFGAWRVMARIPWAGDHKALAALVALTFFALQMVGPFGDHLWFPAMRRARLGLIVRAIDWVSHLVHHVHHALHIAAPDMIALTGDFADSNPDDVEQAITPLADLTAAHGVYFVTGNHEYFWDAAAWMAAFRRLGAKVLTNEHTVIGRGTDAVVVAGVTDISTRRMGPPHGSNPAAALAGAPPTTKILLAHQPASCVDAEKAGADLQLSGHTHSGQYFPFNLMIGWFQRYYKGLNRHGALWVYVNQGTGYWGPPLRAGVPAEVTLLILRRA